MAQASLLPVELPAPAERGGYWNYLTAALGHALLMMLRRQRIILASAICLLPVLLPLAMAYLSDSTFADNGMKSFVRLAETLQIDVLAPLLALFFATMLVAEDAEAQTIPYVLTRPTPRSAWVLGRYCAYVAVASMILCVSMVMTYGSCTVLKGLGYSADNLALLLQYLLVAVLSLAGYGAVTMLLGAVTKRPIVYGVVFLYGWQKVAMLVPGLIDYATIRKYVMEMLPGEMRTNPGLTEKQRQVLAEMSSTYFRDSVEAAITLLCITAVLVGLTILTVRIRQYAAAKAAGA